MFIVLFFDNATSLDASRVKDMYKLTLIMRPYFEKIDCFTSLDTLYFDLLQYRKDDLFLV